MITEPFSHYIAPTRQDPISPPVVIALPRLGFLEVPDELRRRYVPDDVHPSLEGTDRVMMPMLYDLFRL